MSRRILLPTVPAPAMAASLAFASDRARMARIGSGGPVVEWWRYAEDRRWVGQSRRRDVAWRPCFTHRPRTILAIRLRRAARASSLFWSASLARHQEARARIGIVER